MAESPRPFRYAAWLRALERREQAAQRAEAAAWRAVDAARRDLEDARRRIDDARGALAALLDSGTTIAPLRLAMQHLRSLELALEPLVRVLRERIAAWETARGERDAAVRRRRTFDRLRARHDEAELHRLELAEIERSDEMLVRELSDHAADAGDA